MSRYRKIVKHSIGTDHSGIDLEYRPKDQLISVIGHYDSFVGIEGESFTLKEFFDAMGITEQDCTNAFKQQ